MKSIKAEKSWQSALKAYQRAEESGENDILEQRSSIGIISSGNSSIKVCGIVTSNGSNAPLACRQRRWQHHQHQRKRNQQHQHRDI